MGRYPVISVSLKDVDGEDYQAAFEAFSAVISEEATRLDYLLQSDKLTQYDKAKLVRLIEGELDKPIYLQSSLKLLTNLLYKHYEVPVIVLIDEYDVPLDKAYQRDHRRGYGIHPGYITDAGEPENGVHTLAIPNKEVLGIYDTKIHSWLRVKATGNTVNWHRFCTGHS